MRAKFEFRGRRVPQGRGNPEAQLLGGPLERMVRHPYTKASDHVPSVLGIGCRLDGAFSSNDVDWGQILPTTNKEYVTVDVI